MDSARDEGSTPDSSGSFRDLRARILPASQRRSLDELTDDLDLRSGDSASKVSAFWTMLTLSAVIASAGILIDSTATVIGAMIIAPLATPIMGVALAVVKMQRSRSGRFVLGGALVVVGFGMLFSFLLPSSADLLDNPQIAGRTAPGALDLVAALATGLAGAVALARRDVAAVLPGVAIAISLVPPLAVVGVCLGQREVVLALGALLLFLSNLLALVFSGMVVFATLGYAGESSRESDRSQRKARVRVGALMTLVAVPLVAHSVLISAVSVWSGRVETAATEWVSSVPGASVTGVDLDSTTFQVHVLTPTALPPLADLLDRLDGTIPGRFTLVITTSLGRTVEVHNPTGR